MPDNWPCTPGLEIGETIRINTAERRDKFAAQALASFLDGFIRDRFSESYLATSADFVPDKNGNWFHDAANNYFWQSNNPSGVGRSLNGQPLRMFTTAYDRIAAESFRVADAMMKNQNR